MAARTQWSDLGERTRRLLVGAAGCRRHPQDCGAGRPQASASKPGSRPEVAVGHGGDSRQLRRGGACFVLRLWAAAAWSTDGPSFVAGLLRGVARTAMIAGKATAASNRGS